MTTVRQAAKEDLPTIKEIAVKAGIFSQDEVDEFLDGMLVEYFDGKMEGHQWLVAASDADEIQGAVNYAPEPFSDRLYNMYFLGVDPSIQRTGLGETLVTEVETKLRASDEARVLLVDTSSTDKFAGARSFYSKMGFDEEARVREFYGPGDHKVTFWKSVE